MPHNCGGVESTLHLFHLKLSSRQGGFLELELGLTCFCPVKGRRYLRRNSWKDIKQRKRWE